MNELIPVASRQIGAELVLSSDARDLHAFLNVGTEFKDWIVRRIDEYSFEEGKDFCSFLGESTGGRPPKEYIISLDMAKELAMVERTPKGKEARQYYIECERHALAIDGSALPSPERARPARVSERYREAAAITRDCMKTFKLLGLDDGMAKVTTAKEVRIATGLDFTPLLTNVTATNNPRKTVKELAAAMGTSVTSAMVNSALELVGFQVKERWNNKDGEPRSRWVLTEAGKEFGALAPYQADGTEHSGYRPAWFLGVTAVIQPMVDAALAQRSTQSAKRPKASAVAAIEPQGALL